MPKSPMKPITHYFVRKPKPADDQGADATTTEVSSGPLKAADGSKAMKQTTLFSALGSSTVPASVPSLPSATRSRNHVDEVTSIAVETPSAERSESSPSIHEFINFPSRKKRAAPRHKESDIVSISSSSELSDLSDLSDLSSVSELETWPEGTKHNRPKRQRRTDSSPTTRSARLRRSDEPSRPSQGVGKPVDSAANVPELQTHDHRHGDHTDPQSGPDTSSMDPTAPTETRLDAAQIDSPFSPTLAPDSEDELLSSAISKTGGSRSTANRASSSAPSKQRSSRRDPDTSFGSIISSESDGSSDSDFEDFPSVPKTPGPESETVEEYSHRSSKSRRAKRNVNYVFSPREFLKSGRGYRLPVSTMPVETPRVRKRAEFQLDALLRDGIKRLKSKELHDTVAKLMEDDRSDEDTKPASEEASYNLFLSDDQANMYKEFAQKNASLQTPVAHQLHVFHRVAKSADEKHYYQSLVNEIELPSEVLLKRIKVSQEHREVLLSSRLLHMHPSRHLLVEWLYKEACFSVDRHSEAQESLLQIVRSHAVSKMKHEIGVEDFKDVVQKLGFPDLIVDAIETSEYDDGDSVWNSRKFEPAARAGTGDEAGQSEPDDKKADVISDFTARAMYRSVFLFAEIHRYSDTAFKLEEILEITLILAVMSLDSRTSRLYGVCRTALEVFVQKLSHDDWIGWAQSFGNAVARLLGSNCFHQLAMLERLFSGSSHKRVKFMGQRLAAWFVCTRSELGPQEAAQPQSQFELWESLSLQRILEALQNDSLYRWNPGADFDQIRAMVRVLQVAVGGIACVKAEKETSRQISVFLRAFHDKIIDARAEFLDRTKAKHVLLSLSLWMQYACGVEKIEGYRQTVLDPGSWTKADTEMTVAVEIES
ncbi:uncharacterized protein BJ171DRAFT_277054 [Polychytrium aggregatum]|uniref:uncharacterized protein n=1 Tax=Polychytrium aggregatum TaxID=110093 RepID=UPI0022FDEA6E|nr:uncharacterized protein BJ171DRAFT_277054 [Polychytrium aggregatum]KAI9207524.1 hypothetical protein BJ171DRAFT_277054 [Polychytrium aggregatum]